jgi:hypothetical protein
MQAMGQADPAAFPRLLESLETYAEQRGVRLHEKQLLRATDLGVAIHLAVCFAAGGPVRGFDELPASRGYAPLFIANGWNPLLACIGANTAVRHGRRRAAECKWMSQAHTAIRFLTIRHRRRSIHQRAQFLLWISENTSIMPNLFSKAGLVENEFLGLLMCIVRGVELDFARLRAIATQVLPFLPLSRGPKVSVASAAHEFILESGEDFPVVPPQWTTGRRQRGEENVDALTLATRHEFNYPDFDSRPARRRVAERAATKN